MIETFTENIGAGGICVVLDRDFGLFEVVSLEIHLDDGQEPILCKGTIVWVVKRHPAKKTEETKYDTGIEFQDITENDRQRINTLVNNILEARA